MSTLSVELIHQLLTFLPPHWGGLMPVANGLFHRWPIVREHTLEILATLQQFPVRHLHLALADDRLDVKPLRP